MQYNLYGTLIDDVLLSHGGLAYWDERPLRGRRSVVEFELNNGVSNGSMPIGGP